MRKLFCLIMIVGMLALSANAIADDKCDTKEQQAKLETIIQELQQRISEKPNDIQAMTTIIDEKQARLFKEDEYPPCECML